MQQENPQIDIKKVIVDADKLISKINAHLEEVESKYNTSKSYAPKLHKTEAIITSSINAKNLPI